MATLDDLFNQDPSLGFVVVNELGAEKFQTRRRLPINEGQQMLVVNRVEGSEGSVFVLAFDEADNIEVKGDRNYFGPSKNERK